MCYLKKMNKNLFVSLLILIIFCSNFVFSPKDSYAAMPNQITGQSSFEVWLLNIGKPVFSKYNGYRANYNIYKNYQLLSYGTPADVPNNRYDKTVKEYAIHGFSYDELEVTNTYFPEDYTVASNPKNWKNLDLGHDSEISWKRLNHREKEHIKSAPIYYMGNTFGGMTFSSLKLTEAKCIVVAVPSWYMGFALYTNHLNSKGKLRYGTLHGNGIGDVVFAGSFQNMKGSYSIPAGSDYIDITFNIYASVSSFNGLAKPGDMDRGGIDFKNTEIENKTGGPWILSKKIRYYRKNPKSAQKYTQSINETAVVWVASIMGDLTQMEIKCSFVIVEEPNININANFSIRGDIAFFRGTTSYIGIPLPKHDKRFLCLENITIRLEFINSNLPQLVKFYPPGSSPVTVIPIRTAVDSGYAEYKYKMPVIPSTITWSNIRRAQSYKCYAYAYFGNEQRYYEIDGIDITGSVYDIIYLQH